MGQAGSGAAPLSSDDAGGSFFSDAGAMGAFRCRDPRGVFTSGLHLHQQNWQDSSPGVLG